MTNFVPDPDPRWQGCQVSDETPIPRHEFTEANHLHSFLFDEDFPPTLDCPDDCGASCQLADEWMEDRTPSNAEDEARMWFQEECAETLRAAITTALAGEEAGDGQAAR